MVSSSIFYQGGTIMIKGLAHVPYAKLDPRTKTLRAHALHYRDIRTYLEESAVDFSDFVMDFVPSPLLVPKNVSLRDYQEKALESWIKAGMRGCVVLPTGSGKTIIGIKSIQKVNCSTLIVVPTLDLMGQWTDILSKQFENTRIGNLGGGNDDIQAITVATYDSAYIRAPSIGNRFSLIIFDEVHHLAAPGYRSIAEQMAAPYRLGLTATIEREDNLHYDFPRLVGGVVYQAFPSELAKQKHLANFQIERRRVEMQTNEKQEYERSIRAYQIFLNKVGVRMNYSGSFQRLIMMSAKSKAARQALLARNRAMEIALNSKSKIEELGKILSENKGIKTIIFTQHNSLVHEISDRFLIPLITHKSNKEERHDALLGFREGRYRAIVTSKVLDEGVDVPDAELGIILSGTGSGREFIQRLGRLLRPKPDAARKARLIEIISSNTRETGTSAKRKRALGRINEKEK
ncbi:MAG TPA: DEAD/DEAH box helicase family protein [Nitrososphaeraceae archaeon]|jgi:superfamily II DNA or RNA helicase